ncbi:hypothetical protein B0H19DRAFT_1073841 [Mycena capillaripes]|nr:hypothetical protein B0H19DRAFT_1073841 [Mycena capillaripes]
MFAIHLSREFTLGVSLSVIIVLGIIHAVLHLLNASLVYAPALRLRLPLAQSSALQITISTLHAYLLVAFKITMASSILVVAVREIAAVISWWRGDNREDDSLETGVRSDKAQGKLRYSRPSTYPNETILFI